MPAWLPEGNTTLASDDKQRAWCKIADLLNVGTPVGERVNEEGNIRITEEGDSRIIED